MFFLYIKNNENTILYLLNNFPSKYENKLWVSFEFVISRPRFLVFSYLMRFEFTFWSMFFFPFGDFCYSCHHNHNITNWAGQILTWIDPQNASAAPVWILCSNSGFPYLSLCVCASRVGWSAPAVKLSCRTRWTSRSSSTLTPSSMLCARKPPGNDSRLPTPDSRLPTLDSRLPHIGCRYGV